MMSIIFVDLEQIISMLKDIYVVCFFFYLRHWHIKIENSNVYKKVTLNILYYLLRSGLKNQRPNFRLNPKFHFTYLSKY